MSEADKPSRPKSNREDALAVVRRLREAGHVAYFAGGCVRDLLLGLHPKDYDVATDAPPARVQELFSHTQAVGAAFGVILVRHRRSQIEVATFRAESGYQDGRHPSEVRFTTAQEDAQRRDFTINGLFLDPENNQVIDYVGGQEDLNNRRIRAIGEPSHRFDEDSLRLLRAVRFSARFAFPIEPVTASAIVQHAPQLKRISPERIADELRLMLSAPARPAAWKMLWDLQLMQILFRFLKVEQAVRKSDRPFLFDQLAPGEVVPFGVALAAAVLCYRIQLNTSWADFRALLSPRNVQAAVRAMRQALKISNDESEQMAGTLAGLAPLLEDQAPRAARMKRFLAEPTSCLSRKLMDALAAVGLQVERIDWLRQELTELEKGNFAPAPLIDGDVLMAQGLQPGPLFKRILNEVYDLQLEGAVRTREDAIEAAMRIATGNAE